MDQLFEIVRTTFDTPEFRGITFIESEAKSIINCVRRCDSAAMSDTPTASMISSPGMAE